MDETHDPFVGDDKLFDKRAAEMQKKMVCWTHALLLKPLQLRFELEDGHAPRRAMEVSSPAQCACSVCRSWLQPHIAVCVMRPPADSTWCLLHASPCMSMPMCRACRRARMAA